MELIRKLLGLKNEQTIGYLIAQSLRDDHDNWRCQKGSNGYSYVNDQRGMSVSVMFIYAYLSISQFVDAEAPLTNGERRAIRSAIRYWWKVRNRRLRAAGKVHWLTRNP